LSIAFQLVDRAELAAQFSRADAHDLRLRVE